MKKRLLSILLAACLLAGLLPAAALAGDTPSYSIDEHETLIISGTTDGSDLPSEGFTSIEITSTGVVTGGDYTSYYVENYGTITGGEFGEVMNRNGGTGSSLALISGGTFEEVSNYGNMTGGTVGELRNSDLTNTGHSVSGVTVTGLLYNNNSNCSDMTLNIPLEKVTNITSITTVKMTVDGDDVLCYVGQKAKWWLNTYVANATWYKMVDGVKTPLTDAEVIPCQPVEYVSNLVTMIVNGVERRCPAGEPANAWLNSNVETPDFGWYYLSGKDWIKLTNTDVFPDTRTVYSKIPGMSLGAMGWMSDINGNWIARVGDTIGVFNTSAKWYVGDQEAAGKNEFWRMSYTVTQDDLGKDAVAVLTDGYARIETPPIRIVGPLSVTVPAAVAAGEAITPVFNWQLQNHPTTGMTYQWNRGGSAIDGATSCTYATTQADIGNKLTLAISVMGTPYYTTSEVAVVANAATITGVSAAADLEYNGKAQPGYTGTPTSDYSGEYDITYTGRNGTVYNSATPPTNAGDYTVTFTVPADNITYVGRKSLDFSIAKATITIQADDKTAYVGGTAPELTYTVTGLVSGETLKTEPTLAYETGPDMTTVGTTAIKASGAEAPEGGNYDITYVYGTLTVSARPSSGGTVEVSSEKDLRTAIDAGATSIKLMANIELEKELTWNNMKITLDLNGHVLRLKNNTNRVAIKLGNGTTLTLIDSNPNESNKIDGKQYKGGVIGRMVLTANPSNGYCRLNANGGSVIGEVGIQSSFVSIYCTSKTPTAFYNKVNGQSGGSIFGGIFYGNYDLYKICGETVTFNNADGSRYAREVVVSGKTAVAPIPPKVDDAEYPAANGYHINWYKKDATASYDFSTPVVSPDGKGIALTAKWENTYRITYDTGCDTYIAPIMQEYNIEVTAPETPTKIGYTFVRWVSTFNDQVNELPFNMPMEDITVTAQWTPNKYDIAYEGMEGATCEGTLPKIHTYDTPTSIPNPTKIGYTFNGWKVNNGEDLVEKLTLGAQDYTDDITLTAVWTANTYDVMLVTNGGTIPEGNVTQYTYGVGAKLPVKVIRSGYYFAGWYDNEYRIGRPVTEITTTDIDVKTFYAAWIAIPETPTYSPMIENTEGGSVTVSHKYPTAGSTVTITPEPDKGYVVDEITVIDKDGKPVEVTDNGDSTYSFKQPSGKVTVTVTFKKEARRTFVDVPVSAYYYDAVLWAVENDITNGTGDGTTFSPNDPCTRAQMVTFLWRAAGSPEPKGVSSFTDVPADTYYAKAVAWAVENGITGGVGDHKFAPDDVCTRAQMAAFLCRMAGGKAAGSTIAFTDVSADAYYAEAVRWAVENGITEGVGDHKFAPDGVCTRGQMVTFLYRFFVK